MEYIEFNGIKIPINKSSDIIKPILERFNITEEDPDICNKILSEIKDAIESKDLNILRRFLSEENSYWIGNLQTAFFQSFPNTKPLDRYGDWAQVKCQLLLETARQTRENDGVIQHILNYEDFHVEVYPFSFGPSFTVNMYELRGIDFFLFHYMGGETDAHNDDGLFKHASCIPNSLRQLGRESEALSVEKDLVLRKERMTQIGKDFDKPNYDPSSNITSKLRIVGERFWSDYLQPNVWVRLDKQSIKELTDAFSTEYLLKQEVLTTWSTVALILCKVIEREVAKNLFIPWKNQFKNAVWSPPIIESKKLENRINSRYMTFKILSSCASDKGHHPTLGQLLFLAKFWNDATMDLCTDVFKYIRSESEKLSPGFSSSVAKLAEIMEQPIGILNIPDARNRSAHPRENDQVDWPSFIEGLKEKLGNPPAELLRLVVLELGAPFISN